MPTPAASATMDSPGQESATGAGIEISQSIIAEPIKRLIRMEVNNYFWKSYAPG
jgi:hypothetical protein